MSILQHFLNTKSPLILGGVMGTELQRRGYKTTLPLWSAKANLDDFELVKQIGIDFINAGADIIITNTFRTNQYTFEKINEPNLAKKSTLEAVRAGVEAIKTCNRKVLLGASISPLEDCYEPKNVPNNDTLALYHKKQIEILDKSDIDFFLCETFNSIREIDKVISLVRENSQKEFLVSLVTDGQGNLLSGESIADCINKIDKYKPTGILLNCRPLDISDRDLEVLFSVYSGIKGVYANGSGCPHDDLGWTFEHGGCQIEEFLEFSKKWINKGINIIGGCCGTTPDYIKSLSKIINK